MSEGLEGRKCCVGGPKALTEEAQKLETQQPQPFSVMHRELQQELSLIRFPTFLRFTIKEPLQIS